MGKVEIAKGVELEDEPAALFASVARRDEDDEVSEEPATVREAAFELETNEVVVVCFMGVEVVGVIKMVVD